MEKALQVLNELETQRILERYAIGGAIAAVFYMEPVLTYDLDVFVSLPGTETGIVILSPIYEFLRRKGYQAGKEHIIIEGVPIQLIPSYNALIEEAVHEAREVFYKKTRTRVVTVEHLVAIMLQTYRPKDKTRVTQILDEAKVNMDSLTEILARHNLAEKWQAFRRQFHGE